MSGPDLGACGAINPGSIPSVSPFQAADPALAAGSPLHTLAKRRPVFRGLPGFARFALTGNDNVPDPEVVQGLINACLAVATVGSDGPGFASGTGNDTFDGRSQLGRVGRVALMQGVVEHDPVVVVDDLRLVTELDRLAKLALGNGPGVAVVQAHPAGRPRRDASGQTLPGLAGDPPGDLEQLGQVVDRSPQPTPPPAGRGVLTP